MSGPEFMCLAYKYAFEPISSRLQRLHNPCVEHFMQSTTSMQTNESLACAHTHNRWMSPSLFTRCWWCLAPVNAEAIIRVGV